MGFMDRLAAGAERAAKEAEKALDKGKAKVGELQIEMQMDGLAKKLGYLVFDFYRGREVDQALRQKTLDDLSRLEDQLLATRAEAAAKAQARAEAQVWTEAQTRTEARAQPGEAAAGREDAQAATGDTGPVQSDPAAGDTVPPTTS
jgi:hypothetical protein